MKLALGIFLDELSDYHPVVHKAITVKMAFEQICYYDTQDFSANNSFLYLIDSTSSSTDLGHNCPKHLMLLGDKVPLPCLEHGDTVVQIPGPVNMDRLFQKIMNIQASYENWNQSMLLAIIHHRHIGEFLEIAAQKLTNPIALFDNSMTTIAKAGEFLKPSKGTIWEKIGDMGYALAEFFTVQEQRELANRALTAKEPYIYHPAIDKEHTYASSNIWIGGKLYGSLGTVDINSPLSDGQLSIISHVTESLKLYFQNNEVYMHIAENDTNYINNLIEGLSIDEKVAAYHLGRIDWKIHDNYYVLTFSCPVPFATPIESVSYVKHVSQWFPNSPVIVYRNAIVLILRNKDYPIKTHIERERLEQLLDSREMKCGVSACFSDFMQLKYYYVQSSFAVEYTNGQEDTILQFYENCQREHIIHLLQEKADLQSFCHPRILALWNSKEEGNRELVHCLYSYLINGRSLALTSKSMYLHRNTLIYRINKMSNILEMDLKKLSSSNLFYLLFSCMLVEHL